jgi:hypothetical protein
MPRIDMSNDPGDRPLPAKTSSNAISSRLAERTLAERADSTSRPKSHAISPEPYCPRSEQAIAQFIASQRPGWEFAAFAGWLLVKRDGLESKYGDFLLGLPKPGGSMLSDDPESVLAFADRAADELSSILNSAMRLFDPAVQSRAFGPPGSPGDPSLIELLADRLTHCYEQLLEWPAKVRGVSRSSELDEIVEGVASFASGCVRSYREFVDAAVQAVDRFRTMERPEFVVSWTPRIEDAEVRAATEAIERYSLGITRHRARGRR